MRILHFIFLFFFIAGSHAWAMKIGVVDLNRALNESEASDSLRARLRSTTPIFIAQA